MHVKRRHCRSLGARRWAQENPGKRILIGLSGRGDKDMPTLTKVIDRDEYARNKHSEAPAT